MQRRNWVCFEHRLARRVAFWHNWDVDNPGSIHCPVDGEPLTYAGYKSRVPKKNDDKGWTALQDWVAQRDELGWRGEEWPPIERSD